MIQNVDYLNLFFFKSFSLKLFNLDAHMFSAFEETETDFDYRKKINSEPLPQYFLFIVFACMAH